VTAGGRKETSRKWVVQSSVTIRWTTPGVTRLSGYTSPVPADDELFTPSLEARDRAAVAANRLPWRVSSQFWLGFFGGSLAVGAIAWLNGKRLGLPPERQRSIALSTLVAFGLSVAIAAYFVSLHGDREWRAWGRRAVQAVGVLLYLVLARIQKPADRRHRLFGGEYASLWGPGVLALLGSLVATLVLFAGALLVTGVPAR